MFNDLHAYVTAWLERTHIRSAINEVIENGSYNTYRGHPEVRTFEKTLSTMFGGKSIIGVNSGSDALMLALKSLYIGPGDEVIVPAFGFVATASCVPWVGATPVFVDVRGADYTLDPNLIEASITEHTKAIIVSYLFGEISPAILEIVTIAKRHNLYVIEDASQGFGSGLLKDDSNLQLGGTFGDVGCFSLSSTKNFSSYGNAGMIVCADVERAKHMRKMAFYGADRYRYPIIGVNNIMHDIHARILLARLPFLKYWTERSRVLAEIYRARLSHHTNLTLPHEETPGSHTYYRFVVRTEENSALPIFLTQEGHLEVELHPLREYPTPIPLWGAFSALGHTASDFPVSASLGRSTLSLPISRIGGILTKKDVHRVCDAIDVFFETV